MYFPMLFDNNRHLEKSPVSSDTAVSVRNVSKMYGLFEKPLDRLKHLLWNFLFNSMHAKNLKFYREFWALHETSFDVKKGEVFGIIGQNGSGKSTLLQIITGTLTQTSGEIHTNGRIAAMLELGSGFNPRFTGRENVYINGSILGFSRHEIDKRFDEIVSFADIGDFIEQPVMYFSSGMFVRLAFAVQACLDPDILIVDEVLSVGDIFFQQKCHDRMEALIANKTAVIMVSHNMPLIEKYCKRVMLLDKGKCLFLGESNKAVECYYRMETSAKARIKSPPAPITQLKNQNIPFSESTPIPNWPDENAFMDLSNAFITGEEDVAKCTGIALCNDNGDPCYTFRIGDTAYFFYEFELLKDIEVPVGGIRLTNNLNINIHGKNSLQYLTKAPPAVHKGAYLRFMQTMELTLMPDEYTFMVGLVTINPQDYANAAETDFKQIDQEKRLILGVRPNCKLSVNFKTEGIGLPFYGYVDLAGDCVLSVIKKDSQ